MSSQPHFKILGSCLIRKTRKVIAGLDCLRVPAGAFVELLHLDLQMAQLYPESISRLHISVRKHFRQPPAKGLEQTQYSALDEFISLNASLVACRIFDSTLLVLHNVACNSKYHILEQKSIFEIYL